MSKAQGTSIAIKFDDDLKGDPTGLNPPIATADVEQTIITAASSIPGYNSGYDAPMIIDNNLYQYYFINSGINVPFTFDFTLRVKSAINKIGLHSPSANSLLNTEVLGSNDGVNWTSIATVTFPGSVSVWMYVTFTNQVEYEYYRLKALNVNSTSSFYINEIKLYGALTGNERAFTVTATRLLHYGGPTVATSHKVDRVEWDVDKSIIHLRINDFQRFHNANGDILVTYNDLLGTLKGRGKVLSFSQSFTPEDLVPMTNPHQEENLKASISSLTCTVTRIIYTSVYHEENLTASVHSIGVVVTKIGSSPL